MTEIPEHLLKRSKERRAAVSGESADAAAPASASPATVASSAPAAAPAAAAPAKAAPAAPPPPKPDPAYIAAAKSRKRIPFWAMATLSLLPIWGFLYVQGLKPEAKTVAGPIGAGQKLYSSCATCHLSNGAGAVGRSFQQGSLQKTFPHIEDQLNLVYVGSQAYRDAGLTYYGAKAVGHLGYNGNFMPSQHSSGLTEDQILAVVCHERYDLAGVDPEDPKWAAEYTKWCSPDSAIYEGLKDGSLTFDNIDQKVVGVDPVGTKARPSKEDGAG